MAASSIRLRAETSGERTQVRVLIRHPMALAHRDEQSGADIPAHFIEELVVSLNDVPLLRAWWGTGIARNPYLAFSFAGGAAGDRVSVSWRDNQGDSDRFESVLGAATGSE